MSDSSDLRRAVNEDVEGSAYSDALLEQILLDEGSLTGAAARVWQEKAAKYSQMVNMSEGETSRNLGDLQKNAIAMYNLYRKQADANNSSGVRPTTIGKITRP